MCEKYIARFWLIESIHEMWVLFLGEIISNVISKTRAQKTEKESVMFCKRGVDEKVFDLNL